MSGYSTVLKIRRLEQELDQLGFRWGYPKHRNSFDGDLVALYPNDDHFPVYTRDAQLFSGTIEELEVWLHGFKKAREYDNLLFGRKHQQNRVKKEQAEKNRQLMEKIKNSSNTEEE